jgi:hypothetical protein
MIGVFMPTYVQQAPKLAGQHVSPLPNGVWAVGVGSL